MEGQAGSKGVPTKAVPINTLCSSEGIAGCVGQSPWCRVLGEETSGHRIFGRRGAEGAGLPVSCVPTVEGTWGRGGSAGELPACEVPRVQGTQEAVAQDAGPQGRGEPRVQNHSGCRFPGGS